MISARAHQAATSLLPSQQKPARASISSDTLWWLSSTSVRPSGGRERRRLPQACQYDAGQARPSRVHIGRCPAALRRARAPLRLQMDRSAQSRWPHSDAHTAARQSAPRPKPGRRARRLSRACLALRRRGVGPTDSQPAVIRLWDGKSARERKWAMLKACSTCSGCCSARC